MPKNHKKLAIGSVLLLRILLFVFFILVLNKTIKLDSHQILLHLAAVAGIFTASRLAFSLLRERGFWALCFIGSVCYFVVTSFLEGFSTDLSTFGIYTFIQHINLYSLIFLVAAVTTWCFWRHKHYATFELIALILVFIATFSAHRQYRLDQPQFLSNLAWQLNSTPLYLLVVSGALITAVVLVYFLISTMPNKPTPKAGHNYIVCNTNTKLISFFQFLIAIVILLLVSTLTYSHHYQIAETRTKNGIGEASGEGVSPLDFQSGLGTSNQPAAVVRLDSDYPENPFSPKLYFRETAVSEMAEAGMLIGKHELDDDVNFTSPSERYTREEKAEQLERTHIVQSVYLLAKHNNAFAIDYPVNITPLKTPENTEKFVGAYKVYSLAPSFSTLEGAKVGNSNWDEETLQYYTTPHPDIRYKELAEKITKDIVDEPIIKAAAILDYLNKNSIYTLTPNHEVEKGDDPVAPFLFGDMRGYCVHFAHAMVYLLRSLGIPSRIGTGYFTDLSQAKDGHILLRMNDRHAWAEIYLDKIGWVVMDVSPEQVESHAETPVEMDMLEELIGLLGSDEELLPEDSIDNEDEFTADNTLSLPSKKSLLLIAFLILAGIATLKVYLLFCWKLPSSEATKLKRKYRASCCLLYDLGIKRDYAETRTEFKERVSKLLGFDALNQTENLLLSYYNPKTSHFGNDGSELANILRNIPLKKRLLALFNLSSVFANLGGQKW